MRFLENVCVCVCVCVRACVCACERACVCVMNLSAASLETGQRYQVYLWQISKVHFAVVQVQLYSWLDNIKLVKKKNKEKYGKIEIFFFSSPGLHIGRM